MARRKIAPLLLGLGVAAVSVGLFLLLYRYDNKYTTPGPQGVEGIMDLRETDPEGFVLLTRGWELYDGLLEPKDFASTRFSPVKVVAIGQYAGFEAGDSARSPHGSATYRLRLLLPEETRSYTLELPEVYSAYQLYINGTLRMQMGNPDPENYQPRTGNTSVTFDAAGGAEIILAATDYSHFYSGLVYPPAFGSPAAVARLLNTRLILRIFFLALALLVGAYHLITGLLAHPSRTAVLYGTVCLCFAGVTAYPIRGTLAAGRMGWYSFENLCYCAMLALVVWIGCRITGVGKPVRNLWMGAGTVVCSFALIVPRFITESLALMAFYSALIGAYTWTAAVLLTAVSVRGVVGGEVHSLLLLGAVLVFDCALVMDRLLPAFEPLRGGWFIELASGVLVALMGVAVGRDAVGIAREKLVLEGKLDSMSRVLAQQKAQYPVLLENIRETRKLRHDFRHHMRLIHHLAAVGDTEELTAYLSHYKVPSSEAVDSFCENYVLDTVLRGYAALAAQQGVSFTAKVDAPEELPLPDADLVVILSNLLENALEACAYVEEPGRYVQVHIRRVKDVLGIQVRNSYDGTLRARGNRILSRKGRGRPGQGIPSVREAVNRLGGKSEIVPDREKKEFLCKIRIRLESAEEGETP